MRWLIVMMIGCGRFDVDGGTKHEVSGTTKHEFVISIDPKMCKLPDDTTDMACLQSVLDMISVILTQTKDLQK
jgi:hypothetical protein